MPMSTYKANRQLDRDNGKTDHAMLTTTYIALSTTPPTAAGTSVTEPSGSGYARVATTGATWTTASGGAASNALAIQFPEATASWLAGANFTHVAIYDAATGGNMLSFGAIGTPKGATAGDTLSIAAGDLDMSLS